MTTTHLDTRATLGELVKERSTRARILEQHGIDYCCHGHRPLDEAAAEAGIDLDLLVAELAGSDASTGADDVERTPVELVERLRDDHEAAGALLGELRSVTDGYQVPGDACASYTALYERLAALETDTFRHIHLENNVLFPALSG